MSISFLNQLLDEHTDWTDYRRADHAQATADRALVEIESNALDAKLSIEALDRKLRTQAAQLKALRTVVGVLAEMLRDSGVVNGEVLDARLQAAVVNAEEVIEPVVTVTCGRCHRPVERRHTVITADGEICDRCHAGG